MSTQNRISLGLAALLGMLILVPGAQVHAGKAGAFVGGAVAGQVVGQTRRNKKAIEKQEAQAAQPVQQAAPQKPYNERQGDMKPEDVQIEDFFSNAHGRMEKKK